MLICQGVWVSACLFGICHICSNKKSCLLICGLMLVTTVWVFKMLIKIILDLACIT